MKTIRKHLKIVSLLLLTLILFQSCTIYKSVPVSLEEAALTPGKSKVYYKKGYTQKCKRIVKDVNVYRCLSKRNHENNKSTSELSRIAGPIDAEQVSFVNKENRTASTIVNVAGGVTGVSLLIYIITYAMARDTIDSLIDTF